MGRTVLIADGATGIRELLAETLASRNYTVIVANDSDQAHATLRDTELDVMVCDLQVAGTTLLRLAKELASDTEVIVAAGSGDLSGLRECLEGGAFDYLQQPFVLQHFLATIDRAIERRELRSAAKLYESCRAVLDAREPLKLPQIIVEVTMRVMNADDVSLMLPADDNQLYVAYSTGLSTDIADTARIKIGDRIAGRVAATQEPAFLPNVLENEPRFSDVASHGRVHSSIVYPLAANGRLVGVMSMSRTKNPRPFRTRDLDQAGVLASQILLALENAHLVRQLVVAERLASVGQLAAGVAHEINNPVSYVLASQGHLTEQLAILAQLGELISSGADAAAIRSTYEQAGGGAFVSQLREAAEDIREGGMRVRSIVRDIWSLARADEDPVAFDINEAIQSAIRVAASQVKHHAQIIEQLGIGVTTRGNLGRVSQVFVNLLVNAAQAFGPGGKNQITISSQRVGDTVVARVSDNGPGIRADHVARVFDAFFTTKSATTGTGLGLAISREIVRSCGGDIKVETKLGQGSTFTIVLPYARELPSSVEVRAIEQSQQMPRATRILFVDDEPSIRRGYQRAFGRSYEIAIAVDGEDAWRILVERPKYDIIICDLLMPNTGGMELYGRVCATFPELAEAFVFVTGGISEPHIQEFLKSSGRTMLEKPFDMKELREIVEARRPSHRARVG